MVGLKLKFVCNRNQFLEYDNYVSFSNTEDYDSGVYSPLMFSDYISDLVDDDNWSNQEYYENLFTRASMHETLALNCRNWINKVTYYLNVLNSSDCTKFK